MEKDSILNVDVYTEYLELISECLKKPKSLGFLLLDFLLGFTFKLSTPWFVAKQSSCAVQSIQSTFTLCLEAFIQILVSMIRQALIVTLLYLLLVLIAPQSAQKEIPTILIGEMAQGQLYKVDRYKSYHLVRVNSIDKKYLFFSLQTEEVYEGFNLSLTIYKQGTQSPLVHCEKEEVDSCYLFKDQVFLNETLFIVVDCESGEQIEYKLRSYWSDLEHVVVGSDVRFMFSEQEQRQIYHLQLEGMEFKELRIIIRPQTRRYPFDRVKMYGTFGANSNPTATRHDFQSVPLWEDAEGIYLYRSEIKDLTMNLILYGQTKTVYSMRCELVNNTHGDLPINNKIYEYLQHQQQYLYHLKFKDDKGSYFSQSFVYRIAIFTGDLDVSFYKDEKKTQRVDNLVLYAYMGDMQYVFNNKTYLEQVLPNGLYISVESLKRISTFMLQFQGRSKSEALELHQHIYQFLPVEKTQLAFMNVGQFSDAKTRKERFRLVFTNVPVSGKISVELRFCKKTKRECLGPTFTEHTDKILSQVKQVGSKITYTLQLAESMFSKVNIAEQTALIVVVLSNMMSQGPSFSAIEYNVGNRPQFLRENKPIQSYVRKEQLKVYKYICQDPLIRKVKVHINAISGRFDTFAFRRQPSQEELKTYQGKVTGSVVQFSEKLLQQPIVLIISGIDSATYSIVVQPVHSENSELSYITLSEDVEFKMKIASNKFEVFQIVPISSSIFFNYKSTGPLHVCRLNEQMICQQQNLTSLQNSGNITILNFRSRKAYIKVRNPSARIVQVKTIFHSRQEEHCEMVKMGHFVGQILTVGKCLSTVIDSPQGFEVMLVHSQYGHFQFKTIICSQLVNIPRNENEQQRFYIPKSLLQKNCVGHAQYTFSFVVVGNLSRLTNGKVQFADRLFVKYIVQYTNSILLIPDGVGYHSSEPTTETSIKKFAYSLVNFMNTTIVVKTRSKLVFLVKVVQSSQREKVPLNFNDKHFSSPTDRYYFLESIHLTISATQLLKHSCTECELLIFLYSQETIGQYVEFTIQVTQNFEVLDEGVQRNNYLTQNSAAFYSYNARKQGQVLIQLSDNNQNCAQLYVSRSQYPDQNNFDKKSFDGQIIYENKRNEPSNIYISVKARQNCAYSVGASLVQGSIKIKKLQRGILSPLNLKKDEVRYYTFKHLSQSSFKILSLHRYGSIQFYLNKTTPQEVGDLLKKDKIDYQGFQYKSSDKNRLHLTKSSKFLCKGCFYILAAVAYRPTDSSIFLADQQTKIPISEDKVINDILPEEGSFSRGQFFAMQKGIIEAKIHSGKLQVQISFKDQSFSKVFQKTNSKQIHKFSLKKGETYYGTASVIFKALAPNTIYSLRIYKDKQELQKKAKRSETIVNPSEPNYFYLDGMKQSVLKGYLKSKEDRIFISFFSTDKQLLGLLNITGTLNGKPSDISKDVTRNVIQISFIQAQKASFERGIAYELIFSLENQTMSLIAMQSEETNLLPQNVEMLINGKQTYDIYPEGQFLLDIFECRGSASLSYSKTRTGLQSQKQKVLEAYGMPDQSHAIKIDQGYSNLLVRITSPLALVRWLPINKEKEAGLGYYLYKGGSFKYDSLFGSIDFTIQPVTKSVQKTKTQIHDIKYNLYISSSQQDLKQASLCERYLPDSVLQYRTIHQQIFTSSFKFSIDKNKLNEKYQLSTNLFAVIVADLTLTLPENNTQESYRFVYNQQEIPKQLFTPTKLESFSFASLSIFLLILIVALFVCAWLCTKVFVPMIGRLRNRMLIQQNGLQTSKEKEKDIEINQEKVEAPAPLSSERHSIIQQAPLSPSEQRME